MTRHLARNMLFCLAFALPGTAAMASSNPIPGVDIIVKKNPGGRLMIRTDGSGRARLERLVPGDYTLTIRGESLAAAMDRPATPARRSGGRLSIGIGGSLFGGGHHGSSGHQGAGPLGHGASRGGGGHGGVGGGIAIGVGDLNGDGVPDRAAPGGSAVEVILNLGPLGRYSSVTPYCRDNAAGSVTLAFTIPNHGGARAGQTVSAGTVVINAISDQGSTSNLSSY